MFEVNTGADDMQRDRGAKTAQHPHVRVGHADGGVGLAYQPDFSVENLKVNEVSPVVEIPTGFIVYQRTE